MSSNLSTILKKKMTEENLSLRNAGDKAGVAHTTIDRILKEKSVDLETLQKVCDWIGIPLSSVIDVGEEQSELFEDIAALFALNPEFTKVFSEMADKVKKGKLDADILAELTGYASYRMHQKLQAKSKSKK
jgi:transcriptional regulator with XRE-family HTH domain